MARPTKVVSVIVNLNGGSDSNNDFMKSGFDEMEFPRVNEILAEGYFVKDVISTVSNSESLYTINLTFILKSK